MVGRSSRTWNVPSSPTSEYAAVIFSLVFIVMAITGLHGTLAWELYFTQLVGDRHWGCLLQDVRLFSYCMHTCTNRLFDSRMHTATARQAMFGRHLELFHEAGDDALSFGAQSTVMSQQSDPGQ